MVTSSGKGSFDFAAELYDPDRIPLPAEAGRVLDMKMEMTSESVGWYWRNHDSD